MLIHFYGIGLKAPAEAWRCLLEAAPSTQTEPADAPWTPETPLRAISPVTAPNRRPLNKGHPLFSKHRFALGHCQIEARSTRAAPCSASIDWLFRSCLFLVRPRLCSNCAESTPAQQGRPLGQQASICAWAFSDRGPLNKGRPLLRGPRSENARAQIDAC